MEDKEKSLQWSHCLCYGRGIQSQGNQGMWSSSHAGTVRCPHSKQKANREGYRELRQKIVRNKKSY